MEQQSSKQELILKQDDDVPDPTVVSRRQTELEAANDRLQHTAQNFTTEWKSFLSYAMKIKQQRAANPSTDEKDLEDLLLKAQDGLVLLRDLPNRRTRQWKEVFQRYGYQHPSTVNEDDRGSNTTSQCSSLLQKLISKLLQFNEQIAATANCTVIRAQFSGNFASGSAPIVPVLVKKRAFALETHHRLQHILDSSSTGDLVTVEDVNFFMQFNYLKNQQAVTMERFCVRLKWLTVSHRFHLRQRMLTLVHQQKVKNTPQSNTGIGYQEHIHCPLVILSLSHFTAELKSLAQSHSFSLPSKADAEDYLALKQSADALLAFSVCNFPPDSAINTDGRLEMGLETLVHAYTRNSRWELIQRGFIGDCEPNLGRIEDSLSALRNSHKIDSFLATEWELLGLEDVNYLRVRLEALAKAHSTRAIVDIANPELNDSILHHQVHSEEHERTVPVNEATSWNSDAIHALYLLRVSSCRVKRLSLLRLLNYLHFIQFIHSRPKRKVSVQFSAQLVTPWTVTKCEKSEDFIVNWQESSHSNKEDGNNGREFIFAAARHDLEVLELQMLRVASIFLFKQEHESLPISRHKSSKDQLSHAVVTTIDRLQVLRDIYDCEVAFQQAKVQLADKLLENGFKYAPRVQDFSDFHFSTAHIDPFTEILFPLLERRPLFDFSHAYFFESYAAETLLLELQTSLIQQLNQHFQRLEWCKQHEFASNSRESVQDEENEWLCRQILTSNALTRLYTQQNTLLQEADEKWFPATSIGEFHALQLALLEQTVVAWSLIVKFEVPSSPILSLERTSGDLLTGNGWQLVLSPQFLSDVCRTLHIDSTLTSSFTFIDWVAEALEVEKWRRKLAKSVYETHLLERIHAFHFEFVKQMSAFDSVIGGAQARHLNFFFDYSKCDRAKTFQPLALELETSKLHTSALNHAAVRTEDRKSVSEWLQAQLRTSNGDTSTTLKYSKAWRQPLLVLQQQYTAYLEVMVSYQDAIGAEVFEFAASYPFVCLTNSQLSESSSPLVVDLNTVRSKYAKEIADKMREEMKTSCFPYWTRLETLKQQLQERFTVLKPNDGSFPVLEVEIDMVACATFLSEESSHPMLLMTLNGHLQSLRNEKKLMQQLSSSTRTKCAFISAISATGRNTAIGRREEEEDHLSGLMRWLMVKLNQLKVDLQIHERPKVEQLLLTSPGSNIAPSASFQREKRDFSTSRSPESCSPDTQMLLHELPSFKSLLEMFASRGNYENSRRDLSDGVASAHATRLHAHRKESLQALLSIFQQFQCTMDLVRIQCGSRFSSLKKSLLHSSGGQYTGFGRLKRWQSHYHHEIRQILDQITSRLSTEAAVAINDLFNTHPEQLQSTALMREEFCTELEEINVHLVRILKCTTTFALLQTYQKHSSLCLRKRRQLLITIQSSLKIFQIRKLEFPEYHLRDEFSQEKMTRIVIIGERALFSEARPSDWEREWQAFNDAVSKYESRDSAYITTLTQLLELHRVYIDENCHAFLLEDMTLSSQNTAEKQALIALEGLWERFHLAEWDSQVSSKSVRSAIEMSDHPGISSSNNWSYGLRSLQMGATSAHTQFSNTGLIVLPHPNNITDQLVYLHLSVELAWVNTDIKKLYDQYSAFLVHRKRHREDPRTSNSLPSPHMSCPTPSSLLLGLNRYYYKDGIHPDVTEKENPQNAPVFVVPATDMARFLHVVNVHCVEHSKQQLNLHETSMQQLHAECQAAALDRDTISTQWTKAKLEERIRREAFAVDHAFHLYFEVEALRKQLSVMETRKELDRQELRCELNAEYDEKLHAMHSELLNKQQKFAEYRTTVQRELQTVIQGAHSQFVDQLLEFSGTIPSATKTSVSTLLRGQQDIMRMKSENAAMKQALLKVQALGDMQQQSQNSARDRELLLTQRYATAEALQRNEVEKLQTYVKQLEGNLSKLSQEKTSFQVKWTTAQTQMDATTQKRREAKIRSLSASHTQKSAVKTPDDKEPTASFSTRPVPDDTSEIDSVLDGNSTRLQTAVTTADTSGKYELQRLETQYLNSTRHYQNEIRRLQQQVTREIREKGAMAEQLTQLRQYEFSASNQSHDALPLLETLKTPTGDGQIDHLLPFTPRKVQSAAPGTSPRSRSCVAAPTDQKSTFKRPKSSFSPRTTLLRTPVTGFQRANCVNSPSSRPNTASSSSRASTRKFQVVKRDTDANIGGVAGVLNNFSVREPLPYR